MTKGYLILAQNNKDDNYLKMAYALALSIKVTQKTVNNVCLLTNIPDAVPNHWRCVFDDIIQIPWDDDAYFSKWKIENRWKLYSASLYDETVILDADMLFLTDVSHWWEYLSNSHDMCFVTKSITYRNEISNDVYYRKTFVDNNLPNVYSAFFYFKKNEMISEYWKTVEDITKNWKLFFNKFLPESTPSRLSMDVVFGLAAKIHGLEDNITSSFDYPTITHMKSHNQNWKLPYEKWTDQVGNYMNNKGSLKIGNYLQSGIFHYTEKDFLTDDKLSIFERLYEEQLNG